MKKIFLSIAILASSLAAFASTDNTTQDKNNKNKTEKCTPNKECKNKENCKNLNGCIKGKDCKKGERKGNKEARMFQGIKLTDEQQSQIAALNADFRQKRVEASAKVKEAKSEVKETVTAEMRQARKAEKNAKRELARKDYLAKVKNILTPEQYDQFLENNFIFKGHKVKKGDKAMRAGKDNRKGDKAMRGGKDNRKGDKAMRAGKDNRKGDKAMRGDRNNRSI